MRYVAFIQQRLTEMAWDQTLSLKTPRGKGYDLDVHRNPSKTEFTKLLNQSKAKMLRGDIFNGDLLVWDAYEATHGDLNDHYPGSICAYLYFAPGKPVLMNDIQTRREEEGALEGEYGPDLQRLVQQVRSNPSLIHIYGKNFPIVGQDNEDDEKINL